MTPESPSRRRWGVTAGLSYLAIVVVMWAPHTLYSGMGYETHFVMASEAGSGLDPFFFRADPQRIHASFFYHLSYLLGEAVGAAGSYVPYQIVHAVLWWLRGLLLFLLVRRLLPDQPAIAYAAGALALVHAADEALQWVGQMNQFGFIVWMLLACYAAVRAVDAARTTGALVLTGCAVVFAHMSLWSHGSQLPLMLAFPALLVWRRPHARLRALAVTVCMTAVYIAQSIAAGAPAAYQVAATRLRWDVASLAADWWFYIVESVSFWHWRRGPLDGADERLALVAAAVFLAGTGTVIMGAALSGRRDAPASWNTLAAVCGVGALMLVLSFPMYLLSDSARGLSGTLLLSGSGAALTLAGAIAVAGRISGPRLERPVVLFLGAVVVWLGSGAALERGAIHRGHWERHRAAMIEILRVAPSVEPGTLIAVTSVPKASDPFVNSLWMDVGIRLLYPGVPVAGVYYFDDGTPAPGIGMVLDNDRWFWSGIGEPPAVREVPIARTVIIGFDGSGKGTLAATLPPGLCQATCSADLYNPASVIGSTPSARAIRRFRVD